MKHGSKTSCGEKSYVALGVCPICGQENGEIIMDTNSVTGSASTL